MYHSPTRTYSDPPGALACLREARGADTLRKLSAAVTKIDRSYRYSYPMTPTSAAVHIAALQACKPAALEFLPVYIGRSEILRGLDATAILLAYLGDEAAEEPDPDVHARTRIFRNSLESAVLEAEIEDRARDRRAAIIAALARVGEPFLPAAFGPRQGVFD